MMVLPHKWDNPWGQTCLERLDKDKEGGRQRSCPRGTGR